ncbi:E3 ubiquitin-protein ligase TRIM65-like [Hyla sarda]|uniref:E3 ubiquitin-protein ligase TRIM65-like n=1 Tax=Hyla sarda TaxID=327740 RepID=UPI0024C40CE8|nr:E3 ubiquitin-protein ligase TRIM65-like [Hyla sarda]
MEAEDPVTRLRNNLNCSICLEVFTSPLSLPCGHTFCQKCIHEHWDRETPTAAYSCPECRDYSPQRPEPQKNVSLSKVVDDVRTLERSRAPVYPVRVDGSAAPSLCQRHQQGLTLYCSTDSRCICCMCLLTGCRPHDVQEIGELSEQRKKKLSDDLLASDRQQKLVEEEIEKLKGKMENIKDLNEKMLCGMMAKFEQVRKALDECQILVVESATCDMNAASTQAEEHLQLLQSHLTDLKKHRMEAEMLIRNDGVAFLEGLPQLVPVGIAPKPPNVQQGGNLQLEAVTKILPEVTRLLQQELPNLLHPEKPIDECKGTSGSPFETAETSRASLSEQKTSPHRLLPARISDLRRRLYKDYRNLKFDPETANKYLEISHQSCKATHKLRIRRSDVPDSPKRFQTWQVLCTEGFSEGSHYWEVGISTFFVELGVAYNSLKRTNERDSTIGRNSSSWSLQLRSLHHSVWHNNIETKLQSPMFREIGVHLDLTAGSLTYYGIEDGSMQRLHSFSCLFSEKVFPAFWIGEDTNVTIRTIPNEVMETIDQELNDLYL